MPLKSAQHSVTSTHLGVGSVRAATRGRRGGRGRPEPPRRARRARCAPCRLPGGILESIRGVSQAVSWVSACTTITTTSLIHHHCTVAVTAAPTTLVHTRADPLLSGASTPRPVPPQPAAPRVRLTELEPSGAARRGAAPPRRAGTTRHQPPPPLPLPESAAPFSYPSYPSYLPPPVGLPPMLTHTWYHGVDCRISPDSVR